MQMLESGTHRSDESKQIALILEKQFKYLKFQGFLEHSKTYLSILSIQLIDPKINKMSLKITTSFPLRNLSVSSGIQNMILVSCF